MSFNVLMALVGALGMYLIFLGLYSFVTVSLKGPTGGLLYGPEEGPHRERLAGSLLERLDQMLYQARMPVSAGEFLGVSALLGAAVGALMLFATGAPAAVAVGFVSGSFLYYIYLDQRRSRLLDQFEALLPHALRDMRAAFLSKGLSPGEALRYVAEEGPEICRPDFEELAATFSESPVDYARLHRLLGLRGSYALDRAAEALLQFHTMPQRIPEILDLLIPRLRKEIRVRREMRADISSPRWQLVIVVAVPFLVILLLRFAAPEYIAFYSTAVGQLVFIVAFLVDVVALPGGQRAGQPHGQPHPLSPWRAGAPALDGPAAAEWADEG